jgi:hypothetical protein
MTLREQHRNNVATVSVPGIRDFNVRAMSPIISDPSGTAHVMPVTWWTGLERR